MNASTISELAATPETEVGKLKTVGPVGPAYEVGPTLRKLDDGDWLMEITVLESGEVTEYPLSCILEDPIAA